MGIEEKSGKIKKWYQTGNKRRTSYLELLLKEKILTKASAYYSKYQNKSDYISLIGSHIAKSILTYSQDQPYIAKVFMDKLDNKTIKNLKREIKLFHIRYRKIRGITDESSSLIRLADSLCGLIRDINNKKIPESYRAVFNKLKEV